MDACKDVSCYLASMQNSSVHIVDQVIYAVTVSFLPLVARHVDIG